MSDSKEAFAKNLAYYMERAGKTRHNLSDDLGISYFTVTDWVNGKKFPRIDRIDQLAEYFGVQKSDLIEPREISECDENLKLAKKKWNAKFGDVVWTKKELDELMNYASFLLSKRNM